MEMALMKKNRPRRSQRKEKTKERAGTKHPQALSEGGNKQLIAKNHSKKTINEPWIRHDLKYTQLPGHNQPMKGNSHNQHTHRTASTSRSKQRLLLRHEADHGGQQ